MDGTESGRSDEIADRLFLCVACLVAKIRLHDIYQYKYILLRFLKEIAMESANFHGLRWREMILCRSARRDVPQHSSKLAGGANETVDKCVATNMFCTISSLFPLCKSARRRGVVRRVRQTRHHLDCCLALSSTPNAPEFVAVCTVIEKLILDRVLSNMTTTTTSSPATTSTSRSGCCR